MRMYDDLATWWPLLSPPSDYAEEAAFYADALERLAERPVRTLLELGSGGGNNASHLRNRFRLTLVEPSSGMRAVSAALNPGCEHLDGDMRTLRLGREFDAVMIHDAICYMTTESDLAAAIRTAWAHCAPGGAALFAPDYVRETFRAGTDHDGHDGEGRGLRFLEWTHDEDPRDTVYTVDYAIMLRDRDGSVRVEHDRHLEGLFPRETWLRLIREAGFHAHRLEVAGDMDGPGAEVFAGTRPGRP
jgi:SAM-dependent methyltransferase